MRKWGMAALCGAFGGCASALLSGIGTQAGAAESASAIAWKDCQSTDENNRLVGCTSVINAQGFGDRSKLAGAFDGRCWAYNAKQQFAQAVEDCNASIRIRPRYSYAYNNLGTAYLGLHNYEEAIKAFNIAIDLKPDFYWSRLNRAKALVAVGRNQSAAEDYQYLSKRDPTNQELIHSLDALNATVLQKPDVQLADQTTIKVEKEGGVNFGPAGPSFNCANAKSSDEIAICNDPELSRLDAIANSGYQYVRSMYGQRANPITQAFLRAREACASDIGCIKLIQLATIQKFRSLGAPVTSPPPFSDNHPQADNRQPAEPTQHSSSSDQNPASTSSSKADTAVTTEQPKALDPNERAVASAATGVFIFSFLCKGYTPLADALNYSARRSVGADRADRILKAVGAEIAEQMGRRDAVNTSALMTEVSPIVDNIFNAFMSRKDREVACREIGEMAIKNGFAERQ